MKKILILPIFIMLFTSGCSFSNFNTNNLMHPPKATGEMAQIQALIEHTVGEDIIFKYPQNGDFKSAIIMHDLDGDSQDEAIAVYQLASQDAQSYIMVIDKVGDTWKVIKTIDAKGVDLDKVCFGDINGDNIDDIILGWSSYTSYGKELTVILYEDGNYNDLTPEETYSDILVSDFDGDGRSEVLTLSVSKREDTQSDDDANKTARARLLKLDSESRKFKAMGSALIDSTVVKYNHTQFGKIDDSQYGAVIDAITDKGRTMTEIVYWDKASNRLRVPFYDSQKLSSPEFLRNSIIHSSDINNDGIIEIPKVDLADGSSGKFTYVLSWFRHNVDSTKNDYVESLIMNEKDSYIFVVPAKWKRSTLGDYNIRFGYDYNSRILRIFERVEHDGQVVKNREFLNIAVFSKKEFDELPNKTEYQVLAQEGNRIYTSITLAEDSELAVSAEEIKNNFRTI